MDRNFFLAIALTTLIIFLYSSPAVQRFFGQSPPVQTTTEEVAQPAPVRTEGISTISEPESPSPVVEQTSVVPGYSQVNVPESSGDIILENDNLVVLITPRGGAIISTVLKEYEGIVKEEPVQIVEPGKSWYEGSVETRGARLDFSDLVFVPEQESPQHAILTAELDGGRKIHRIFSLEPEGYLLNAETLLEGDWGDAKLTYSWTGKIAETERPFRQLRIWPFTMFMQDDRASSEKAVFLGMGDLYSRNPNGREKSSAIYANDGAKSLTLKSGRGTETFSGELEWKGVRNKYFLTAAIPVESSGWRSFASSESGLDGRNIEFNMSKDVADGSTDLDIYLGPLSYSTLREYKPNLTESIDMSWRWIRPISIGFLWIITSLHTVIPNWGVVLILLSIIIKLVLYPLSKKSFVSMRKMSKLQPQMAALREKYKDNPQMIQQATMELYKREKINPLGGCLPTLVQLPVFFALYPIIGRAFELRQAMFIPRWIEDLSLPDPYFILPLVMGLAMFLQSKDTMKDPNQKPMLYIMPVMMVILFANFGAGLTLYWLMFSLLSWAQQRMYV